jgi:hypothetical protein
MIVFIIGFILTMLNSNGILLSPEKYIPLHWIGIIVGCLLMAQSVNQLV